MNMIQNENTKNNCMTIADFVGKLVQPVKNTFHDNVFTIVGDVERVNPWNEDLYVHLVDKTTKVTIPLTVLVRQKAKNSLSFNIEVNFNEQKLAER